MWISIAIIGSELYCGRGDSRNDPGQLSVLRHGPISHQLRRNGAMLITEVIMRAEGMKLWYLFVHRSFLVSQRCDRIWVPALASAMTVPSSYGCFVGKCH